MPDIKLGVEGSEIILPKGVRVEVPVTITKNIKKAEMSDGSYRRGYFKNERRCTIKWKPQALSYIKTLINLTNLNQMLRFQNGYEDDTWYDVTITSLSYDAIDVNGVEMYIASMEIEGAI